MTKPAKRIADRLALIESRATDETTTCLDIVANDVPWLVDTIKEALRAVTVACELLQPERRPSPTSREAYNVYHDKVVKFIKANAVNGVEHTPDTTGRYVRRGDR